MFQKTRYVQSDRFELLQQAEDHRRSGGGETVDPARLSVGPGALFDHDDLVDGADRSGDGAEDRRGGLDDRGQLL